VTSGKSSSGDPGRSARPVPAAAPAGPAPKPPERPSIGRLLVAARLAAGQSVEEVSAETSVRVPIIHAIEEDDFTRCGGDVYARGHIRSIARAVGVNGDALVARFDAERVGTAKPAPPLPLPVFEADRMRAERRRPNWAGAMVAAIVVTAAVIGFNLASGKTRETAAVADAPAAKPSAAAKTVARPKPKPALPKAPPAGQVTVKISADGGDSWLEVKTAAGKTLFRNDLAKGATQTFNDPKQLKVIMGDAGAIHLWVNGKDLGTPGDDGQVLKATFRPAPE
jgi:cytoskeleton protein RodZ